MSDVKWRKFVEVVEARIVEAGVDPETVEIDYMDFNASWFGPKSVVVVRDDEGSVRLAIWN